MYRYLKQVIRAVRGFVNACLYLLRYAPIFESGEIVGEAVRGAHMYCPD